MCVCVCEAAQVVVALAKNEMLPEGSDSGLRNISRCFHQFQAVTLRCLVAQHD